MTLVLTVIAGWASSAPSLAQTADPSLQRQESDWSIRALDRQTLGSWTPRSFAASAANRFVRSGRPASPPTNPEMPVVNVHWAAPGSGNWTEALKWTGGVVPNNGTPAGTTYHAFLDASGAAHTVTLDTMVAVDDLTMNSPNAKLRHTGGTFSVNGTANLLGGVYELIDLCATKGMNGPVPIQSA